MIILVALLTILLSASSSFAVTLEWPCNDESDMKDYRLEYATEPAYAWGVVDRIEHIDGCESIRYPDSRYLAPGRKRYRVFAGNRDRHYSTPSPEAWITIPVSPVGNPGGSTEVPLPPSPYDGNTDLPPVWPPPVEPPPVEPPPVLPSAPIVTMKEAMQQGLSRCLDRKLAHTACMKALAEALGKVTP